MRALLRAALLLPPTVINALAVPSLAGGAAVDGDSVDGPLDSPAEWRDPAIYRPVSVSVDVAIPGLPESLQPNLTFRVDVQSSDEVCGQGKLLINGGGLPQELRDGKFSGQGPLTVGPHTLSASWDFECLTLFDEPHSEHLTFAIKLVDGQETPGDTGFTLWFSHHREGRAVIAASSSTSSALAPIFVKTAMPLDFFDHDFDQRFSIEDEVADLEWMESQLRELHWQIAEKKRTIQGLVEAQSKVELARCESMKCVARGMLDNARRLAHRVLLTLKYRKGYALGQNEGPSFCHGKARDGNCSHPHLPKHGNHSFPHPFPPPPPHRRPHRLPICHFPPPPHHRPAHPPPKGPGKKPHRPHQPPVDDHHSHGRPGPPEEGHDHPKPELGDPYGPPQGYEYPPSPSSPELDGPRPPPSGHFDPLDAEHEADDSPFPYEPEHDASRGSVDYDFAPRPPRRRHGFKTIHFVKAVIVGALAAILAAALHRRYCHASKRAARQARREARQRRRAERRAANEQAWTSWARNLCRYLSGRSTEADDDYDEKCAILAGEADGEMVSDEIRQFANAAGVVDAMVAAEEGRVTGRSSIETSLPSYLSDAGDGLPSYDDTENEVSSMVSDGFRPANYTPSHSDIGSVRSVLGDVKG
ncbi:MAG: hypothetical protein M1818_000498 [Claussenomyces sp. TS43310]|nr:MAG: hypothetical protein M1818_000498 [Claussenomyces sp. TS43310]